MLQSVWNWIQRYKLTQKNNIKEKEKEIIIIPQHLWVILRMQNYENKEQIL
jgi:hypothetical protein